MFDATVNAGVLRVLERDARWLSTGWAGGLHEADAAYNVSVPAGWDRMDLDACVEERRESAGFDNPGPALLTGVDLAHLRGARSGPVVVYATAGLSNPAALPVEDGRPSPRRDIDASGDPPTGALDESPADVSGGSSGDAPDETSPGPPVGTVNLVAGTTRSLDDAALANLLAVVVEAKTATLLAETGFPGTTTDAAIVATSPDGEPATFAGSATPVGASTRACVREAVRASLTSRYADRKLPTSVDAAKYGTATTRRAEVFSP